MKTQKFVAIAALLASCGGAFAQTGPSTTTSPYLVPSGNNGVGQVSFKSILTVGDTVGGYRMVGIPDGLGAYDNGDGTFSLLMNHELGATAGISRAHGSAGAFVSQWNISKSDLTVNSGRDFTPANGVQNFTGTTAAPAWTAGTTTWSRFCSGDLGAPSAYKYTDSFGTTYGTDSRIYLAGEETGTEGRAFAHVVGSTPAQNQSFQLSHLGRFSWENAVANPLAQRKTIVAGQADTAPGGVYFYVGDKQTTGNDVQKAGLVGGSQYALRAPGLGNEANASVTAAGQSFSFDLKNLGDVSNLSGTQLAAAASSSANGGAASGFLRPEDGAWDPRPGHQNDYYFVTTNNFTSPSRLWKASFADISNPAAGGTLTAVLSGTEGQRMFDNICIDNLGRIVLQEDIGGQNALGKIWLYDINSGGFGEIAQHDPARFTPGAPGFLTNDEESSGIIDASAILGQGYFLLDVQAHYGISGELVEGGQLLSLYIDPSVIPAPSSIALLGLGGLLAGRRRRQN